MAANQRSLAWNIFDTSLLSNANIYPMDAESSMGFKPMGRFWMKTGAVFWRKNISLSGSVWTDPKIFMICIDAQEGASRHIIG
jgi:hypothetical protein